MFKIVRFPSKLKPFFCSLKTEFLWEHFEYFQLLVLLICFAWGRRNISALYQYLGTEAKSHRSRFNNFVNLARWDSHAALERKAYELLLMLKPGKTDVIELVLDDSKKQKRGKDMQAVGWIHDPVSGAKIRGHQYVMATIRFKGQTIPFGIRLYVKQQDCPGLGLVFKKTTELAADLIKAFSPPVGIKVRVLFDSYYLCPVLVKACRSKGFCFVSVLKNNRNMYKNGRKLKAGAYGSNLFRCSKKKTLRMNKSKGTVAYRYIDAGWLTVSKLGTAHVVFSRKNQERGILGLVTDEPKLSAGQIIQSYDRRWSIEVFFKETKQLLGLGQYQNGSYRAAVTHLHLVCFAYALLTHLAITGAGAQGKKRLKIAGRLSTSQLQNELRRIVWDDMADYLKELPNGNSVVKELSRLLIAA